MKIGMTANPAFVLLFTFAIIALGMVACGKGEGNSQTPPSTTEVDNSADLKEEKPIAEKQKAKAPKGWKTYGFEGWSISFPADWGGEEDIGVWWPGEGSMDMGRPPISVHTGGSPIMPNSTFEKKVRSHMNSEPLSKEKFSSSGFSGLKCTWESNGKKYLGVFLEEEVGGGVGIAHFVNCRAPTADFDKYKGDFEKIVSTYKR